VPKLQKQYARVRGLAVAGAGALLGWLIHLALPWVPWLTASLVIGVALSCIPALRPSLGGTLRPGLAFAERTLLRAGIVVLGLKLSLLDIASLGWFGVITIIALVIAAFIITYWLGRAFRLPGDEPVLLAAGFSICGVSAVGAMSAARRSPRADTALPVALVTLYGTLAILVVPALATLLDLTPDQAGHWAGLVVHDVGQVVATAGTLGSGALAVAVIVKLTRVLMLAPMVAIASMRARRQAGDAAIPAPMAPIVPIFIIGFLVAVVLRTFVQMPDWLLETADVVQSAFLAMALTGIGAGLRLERLVRWGGPAMAVGALAWFAILGLALVIVYLVPVG